MKRLMIPALAIAALILVACGDSNSAKACQKPVYCYKTTDAPTQRKCDMNYEVVQTKVKKAEEDGTLSTPMYEECFEY